MAGEGYAVMAAGHLDPMLPPDPEGVPTAFGLYIKPGLRATAMAGMVDILASRGSPEAPTVDILAQGVGPLFTGLQFTDDSTDTLVVSAGDDVLDVTPAGMTGTVVASFAAKLTGLGGTALVATLPHPGDTPLARRVRGLPGGTAVELPSEANPVEPATCGEVKNLFENDRPF